MFAWNLGTSWEQSPDGLLGAHGVLGQGWQLGGQHSGREKRIRPGHLPHTLWILKKELRVRPGASRWRRGDAFQVSDGGDVMGGTGQGQGSLGFSLYFFNSLYPFYIACLPTPIIASDPEAPAAPHSGSGKSLSSMLLWVASFSQAKILGFAGYLCISSTLYSGPILHSSCNPLSSPPVGEMAAPAGPNIYVYCNFRAINLKGSAQADEIHPPHCGLARQVSGSPL